MDSAYSAIWWKIQRKLDVLDSLLIMSDPYQPYHIGHNHNEYKLNMDLFFLHYEVDFLMSNGVGRRKMRKELSDVYGLSFSTNKFKEMTVALEDGRIKHRLPDKLFPDELKVASVKKRKFDVATEVMTRQSNF